MERITKEKFFMVKPFFITALLLLIGLPVLSNDQIIRGKTVIADQSMIVTRHYLASEIGNQILLDGGNAIDASVAVSFASVSYTHLTLPTRS